MKLSISEARRRPPVLVREVRVPRGGARLWLMLCRTEFGHHRVVHGDLHVPAEFFRIA
jgi:hypothetical protein